MKITDVITEAANPAQQAAKANAMKKAGKKPKQGMAEGAEPDDVFEADDWEEVGDKWKRFQKWAIDQIMRSTEKVETGNYVSKLENQYFGHPINVGPSNASQQPFGTVTTNIGANKRWTEFVQSIIDNYQNYEAEWKADSAAALLDNPEYNKFLDRAYTDFMGMGENTTEQREQHAMALSGYQVKYFGGKLFGSLFGNIQGARASMTPEVYGALEKAQYDLEQKKITDWDDKRRAEQLKFWQMLPYPIKLMVAAGMGKTPAQVEAILSTSGKSDNEIMGAYIDASNVPGYTPGQQQQQTQRPPMNEPPRLEGKDKVGNMDADAFDAALSRMKKLAGADPLKTVYNPAKTEDITEDLSEEFDLIESIVEQIAEHNGVDAEAVWEDLESLTEDELYVFAVTSDPLMEDWQKANKRDKTDGMSQKAVNAYRRENPGSKLKTAVTTKPGKLKKGGKASKRRKSYCSRSRGQMKMHSISCAKTPDKAICKARRRWNC